MIHGLWGGLGMLLELVADIVDDRRFGHLGDRLALGFEPAGKVDQIIGVSAERAQRELPEALGVEEHIRPVEFPLVLVAQAVRRGTGGHARLIDHREFHSGSAPSKRRAKSAALAPRTK